MPPRRRAELSLRAAIALGALQGPTELLPVSSSAHTTLIPWLAGRSTELGDPELRKAFEVALHSGAGVALAIELRGELLAGVRSLDRRSAGMIALATLIPALAGYALERPIERRLSSPGSIAVGLVAGSVAMVLADRQAGARAGSGASSATGSGADGEAGNGAVGRGGAGRRRADAGPADGLALGLAQALALVPGVSRNGATLAAARARGFTRADASALSWHAALPVILGASTLKALRLLERGRSAESAHAAPLPTALLLAGAASAFASTLASARVLRAGNLRGRPLAPFAAYRCALAALVARRLSARRSQLAR